MLPFGGEAIDGEQVGPLQALMAAREAVGDIAGICERKPDVCETGKSALHTIGVRAKASAKIAYEMLDDQLGRARLLDQHRHGRIAAKADVPPNSGFPTCRKHRRVAGSSPPCQRRSSRLFP